MIGIELLHLARLFSKVLRRTQQRIAPETFRVLQRFDGRSFIGVLLGFRIETLGFLLVQRRGGLMITGTAVVCHPIF